MQCLRTLVTMSLLVLGACSTKPSPPDESEKVVDPMDDAVASTTSTTGGTVDWKCVDQCVRSGNGGSKPYCYESCSY